MRHLRWGGKAWFMRSAETRSRLQGISPMGLGGLSHWDPLTGVTLMGTLVSAAAMAQLLLPGSPLKLGELPCASGTPLCSVPAGTILTREKPSQTAWNHCPF